MKIDKKDLLVYFLYLALTLAFFHRFLTGAEMFALKDLSRYFYPLRYLMVEQVRSGIMPLWNPYIFCGLPLVATLQVCFFYPLTILLYLLPFDLGFNYYTIIHYFLAACFMYLMMRHFKLDRYSAFLSGAAFAFSGYLLSISSMNTSLSSVIWLPLVVLFWDKVLSQRSHLLGLILSLALMFLGGEPTIIYITGWLLLFYALILYRDHIRNVLFLGVAAVTAAGLVAVQLVPFLELLYHSDRGLLSVFYIISRWSFPPREVLHFILPFFFGNPLRAGNYTEILLGSDIQAWLLSPYLGFLVVLFALLGSLKADKQARFFAGAGVVALLLAFGRYTPLYQLFYKLVPGFSLIRYPVKYLFLVTFCVSFLAGVGFNDLMGWGQEKIRKLSSRLIVSLAGLGAVTFLLLLFREPAFVFLKSFYPTEMPEFFRQELRITFDFGVQSLVNLWAIVLAGAVVLFLISKKIISRSVGAAILIAMVLLDLAAVNLPLSFPLPAQVIHGLPPNVEILIKNRALCRYFYTNEVEKSSRLVFGEDIILGMLENKDKLPANRLIPYHLFDIYGYESIQLETTRRLSSFYHHVPIKVINLMNGKYIASAVPLEAGLKLVRRAEYYVGELYLYESPRYLPRAYVVYSARTVPSQEAALYEIMKPDLDPAKEVVLEEPNALQDKVVGDPVKIIKYSPAEVIIEARTKRPGLLFLSDTYYPGWKAYVDGREKRILRANYMFRGVMLDKGEHEVRFVYDPLSFKIGLLLSGLTILGLAGMGWYLRTKKD